MTSDPDPKLFDEVSGRQLDLIQAVLFTREQFTHLPELYEIVGRENFLKFVDILGGQTIKIPERAMIEQAIRDTSIYYRIKTSTHSSRPTVVRDLGSRYTMSYEAVSMIYIRMGRELRRLGHPDAPPDGEDFDVE